MKKTICILVLLTSFLNSNAQSVFDLKAKLISPADNDVFVYAQAKDLKIQISNLSNLTYASSDSIAVYVILDGDSLLFSNGGRLENFKSYTGMQIAAGDSQTISFPLVFTNSFPARTYDFCVFVKPLNRDTRQLRDTILRNNGSCARIKLSSSSGVSDSELSNSLRMVPNPVSSFLSIESEKEILNLRIFDLSGRQIQIEKSNMNKIDVSTLSNGIYCLKISTANEDLYRKIVVEH